MTGRAVARAWSSVGDRLPVARAAAPARRAPAWRRRDAWVGFAFVAPQLAGWVAFVLVPLGMVAWYSLNDFQALTGSFSFSGLGNYQRLVHDEAMRTVARNTIVFSLGLVPCNIALALGLAVLLDQRLRGTSVLRTLFFSPVVVSLVAWAIVWRFMLQDDGGVNSLLRLVGIDGPNWLRGGTTAMVSVIVVQVVKNVGLNMVLFLAALQGVPRELREAATIDGAGAWTAFRRITLPLITPTVLMVTIITVIGSLQVFAQILLLTGGGPGNATNVLVFYIYSQAFRFFDLGYASALAVVLFAVVLVLTVVQWRMRTRWVFDEH